MQVEANSERRVKILGIDRSENSPVLTYMETEDDPNFRNSKLAAAPHTVHMMDSGFLAINRQCLVKGKAILAREPKSSNEHMIDDLPKHAHDQHTLSILRDFIDQLKLHNVYEINFYDPLDSSGKLAVIPMLIALWKCMLASETDICDQEVLKSIMNSVIAKFELQIPCKNAVIDATLSGSREEVHIIAEDGSLENSNGTTEHFNKKHDLVFVKTDLHPEDFTPQMFPSQAKAKLLRDAFNNEEDEDTFPDILVPAYMTAHSKNRVRQEDYTCLEVEFDSQVALEKLMNEHEQVEGFEVQQGGILVALKKDSFFDDELIEKIAVSYHIICYFHINCMFDKTLFTKIFCSHIVFTSR
nr:product of the 2.5kb transcript [Caenorhabditis elegans]